MTSRTQIVCTIGPASQEPAVLDRMIAAGMDVARLNFSHGTYENHAMLIANVRDAAKRAGKVIPIIQDLSGPRMKTETGHQMQPGATVVITEKDLKDLDFGLAQKVEYVCQSFVGAASDIEQLKNEIRARGGTAKAMAKVERAEALENIESIVAVSDAVMLGRGDLGQNIPIEQVPFAEALVVHTCNTAGKPVIVATQMLESMVNNAEPTRAEVTDIAYAIILGADAVMLSEESALGKFPVEAVAVMEKVAVEAEKYERTYNAL
ncbi:MAG TPA: pyruvate kinase [Candidatus Paceibacterota bacterium]|nr:pyruvate kinase [Candidatus Paceibacterota bacterium]